VLASKVCYIAPLPKVTDKNFRIIATKLNPEYTEPKYFIHDQYCKQMVHLFQYLAENDSCFRFEMVVDWKGVTIGHGARVVPMNVKKITTIFEKVFSNRIASLYMVNFPSVLETILNTMVKPFLNAKLRERLKISSGNSVLIEEFGKDRIPVDMGGEEKSMPELSGMMMKKYEEHKERFYQLENLRVDESLRPAKLKNDELLGYYGNFKKINLD